jgi:hypothetical protein
MRLLTVLTAVIIRITVLRDVTPCSLVGIPVFWGAMHASSIFRAEKDGWLGKRGALRMEHRVGTGL